MKRKGLILGAAALAVLLCLCLFDLRLRIAPRWMLSQAMGTALTELEQRFEKSPIHLIASSLDRDGNQQADFQLETQLDHLGIVRYDMNLQTQLNPCRVKAIGTVVTDGKMLDLELFLDRNFAAVASPGLLDGGYYGIRYNSFSRDIRSRELLAALIGEKTIAQWEEAVSGLQQKLSVNISMPEFSPGDVPGMLYALLALKPETGREEIPLSGRQESVCTVTFRATGQEIAAMAESYLDRLNPELTNFIRRLSNTPDAAVQAVFYLHEEMLVRVDIGLIFSGNVTEIRVELGENPAADPLNLELETQRDDEITRLSLRVDTISDDAHYEETIRIAYIQNGIQHGGELDYDWDLSSGEMDLTVRLNNRQADTRLNLAGEGECLTIRTQDAAPLLNLLLKKPLDYPAIITLNLSPGGSVEVPEYRNLNQWSLEDLYALLSGFGRLLGMNVT